ncbi:MAG: DUF1302 family protein [Halanaerobiaceae bacterium]
MKKNIQRISVFILSIIFVFIFSISGNAVYYSNSLINNYSYDLENDNTFTSFVTYDLEVEERFSSGFLYINPEFTYNYKEDEGDIDLDEAYVDLYFNNFDLRTGKQMMTWGKADGLVVTNFVNPEDLTESPVIEYEDRFKSINSIKLNYFMGNDSLEVVWIPEFEPVTIDENLFNNQIRNITGSSAPVLNYSEKEVETELENSELALKYSSLGTDFDYELVAGYIWDDHPSLYIQQKPLQEPEVTLKHERLTVAGGSFSTSRDAWVIRGDGLYTSGKKYNGFDPEYEAGLVAKNNIKWMIGADYTLDDYLLSGQLYQEVILDYEDSIIQDEFSSKMTFMTQRQFLRDKLDTKITFFYDFNQESLKAKPEISYNYNDDFKIEAGADYMLEDGSDTISSLANDVIYVQSTYMF